ncbi:MAG: 2'-5' RNA ligase family protein, partial [Actinomycetota bacterium]
WVGLEAQDQRLHGVADVVAVALEPLGFPREARAWTPHLSIARLRTPASLAPLPPASPRPLAFDVAEITLFRSRLARPAPRYEPVARVRFEG